jgi:hypothetical protein
MKDGLTFESYTKKRPRKVIPYGVRRECCTLMARNEAKRTRKDIKKELMARKN